MLKDFEALWQDKGRKIRHRPAHPSSDVESGKWMGRCSRKVLHEGLDTPLRDCATEKNCTLIRYDIIEGFGNLYDVVKEEKIREKALELIETEPDLKYRKKYAGVWKK